MSLAENSGRPTWVRHSSSKSSATHSYQSVHVQRFRVSTQWYGCQCLGLLTCTQMLMHAIAHGGCADTVRGETALKANSGRKIPSRTGDSKPYFSVGRSTHRAISVPLDRRIDADKYRQAGRRTYRFQGIQRQTGRQTCRQTNRQTDRQTV